jgi:dipeptidyl-peptidase-3
MNVKQILTLSTLTTVLAACSSVEKTTKDKDSTKTANNVVDRFADAQVLRYEVNSWDKLTLKQKEYAYYLSQAGLCGRDINYDQNNKYNIRIRKANERILESYSGERTSEDWKKYETWAKQVFFSNGIHHHYGMDKLIPTCSKAYFSQLVNLGNADLDQELIDFIFDAEADKKRKVKDPNVDMVVASANNFYGEGVTQKMVEEYYDQKHDDNPNQPIEWGLNSTLILKDGKLVEDVWKAHGRYGSAINQMIYWLKKAITVTENIEQAKALETLINYYSTGDLKLWDNYNILWSKATEGDIDYINGFIEVYGDALGKRANFESIVQIKDFEASKRMALVAENAQWFEDNSPILAEHKKKNVVGITYNVVEALSESGDAAPTTPIGVNLPNNDWIRQTYGSKSVSLGNIIEAYDKAGGPGLTKEFAHDQAEIDRAIKHGSLAGKIHTALHEVIGHASGQINPGVGQTSKTLKNYASTLEEARADLVGLYYINDKKLVDLGLIESLEVGKAEYDGYIRNGLMTQLQRLELGQNLEEEHMQNRQLVAAWVFEKGAADNVVSKIIKDGKTYFKINDYNKLRTLFGELLRDIQRIKSEGDYEAGKALVETYGVKVDPKLHAEVLARVKPLNIAPYSGFVYPEFELVYDKSGAITDIKLVNNSTFIEQMLSYGKKYSFLK